MSFPTLFESRTQKGRYSLTDLSGVTQCRHVNRFVKESAMRIDQLVRGEIDSEIAWIDLHERICRFIESYYEWAQKIDSVPFGSCWKELLFQVSGDPWDQMEIHVRVYTEVLEKMAPLPIPVPTAVLC